MSLSLNQLLDNFALSSTEHYAASHTGDWQTVNRLANCISSDFREIIAYGHEGRERLLSLADDPTLAVAAMAATYSLKYNPDRSIAILRKISQEPGLIGFEAGQAVNRWEEGSWHLED